MSTRKRTQEDVIDYIKNHASEGKLQQSLMEISEHVGYSNATIHRVLKNLEEQGIVEVHASGQPTKPNTIIYKGPIETADDIIRQGVHIMEEITHLTERIHDYMQESHRVIESLKTNAGEQHELESRISDIIEMPDGEHYMMIVKKTSDIEPKLMRNIMLENKENEFS